ncbi:hypothetical protein EMCG_01336 [[Emmonsia] crescens]|uniref:Fungal-type protein kinase domain-containing protein n=1 Tax=[Emmonsia] crescens TaxID=73230 RepID=A0A0G2JA46_9EURO|nr:hypothetical protein EMCG_01336 [Emmonsia crescens UAMH 3008]
MAELSHDENAIIKKHPLTNSLGQLSNLLRDAEKIYESRLISYNGADDGLDQLYCNTISKLLATLQAENAAYNIRSRMSNKNMVSDLAHLVKFLQQGHFCYDHYRALVHLVIQRPPAAETCNVEIWNVSIWKAVLNLIVTISRATPPPRTISSIPQTPWLRNTSSFANSTEYRKYIDNVLKEELGELHVDIPGFFDAYFKDIPHLDAAARAIFNKCKDVSNPLYDEEGGWRDWPEHAAEKDVLKWLVNVIDMFVQLAGTHEPTLRINRRPLTQPNKPLPGSIAERKLDIGFVDNLKAGSGCSWSEILVPGELKNDEKYDSPSQAWLDLGRYAREVLGAQDSRRCVLGFTLCGPFLRLWQFDRLGGIASERFSINENGFEFVSAILGFLLMSRQQLGFDPTIIGHGLDRCIEITKNGRTERLVIDRVIGRARCIAGRATTCWKVHREADELQIPMVVKDSWQYPERDEEGELLCEATEKGVINVARYYHSETVQVNGMNDDILSIRKNLPIPAPNQKRITSKSTASHGKSRQAHKDLSSSTGQKRSVDSIDMALPPPPSKRPLSSSPTKLPMNSVQLNRVHRRVIVRDYGKPIFESSTRIALLAGMEGCIKGYISLYEKAGLIQSDISPRNLLVNEDDNNPSWRSFLIDLDLAVKVQRDGFSGARGKTGTRAFMAIGVLYGEKHSYMHDLESFFWVLFWICIHYDGPGKGRVVERFDKWNYMNTEELGDAKKGVISDEGDFLRITEDNFTPYYQSLITFVNRLRRLVFPDGGRWKQLNSSLSQNMIEELQRAQNDSNIM